YFGLTRPLNSDKRCKLLSKSPQANQRLYWSRCGVKISTDQTVIYLEKAGRHPVAVTLKPGLPVALPAGERGRLMSSQAGDHVPECVDDRRHRRVYLAVQPVSPYAVIRRWPPGVGAIRAAAAACRQVTGTT